MTLAINNILMDHNILRPSPNNILKVVILGDSAVGKTSLIKRFLESKFNSKYNMTIGVNIMSKQVPISNKNGEIFIFSDLAGQTRFKKIRTAFYVGAEIIIAVCDLTRKMTLENLENIWIPEFLSTDLGKKDHSNIRLQLVANKCDLEDLITISERDLKETEKRISKKYQQVIIQKPFLKVSAKINLSVNEIFQNLVKNESH